MFLKVCSNIQWGLFRWGERKVLLATKGRFWERTPHLRPRCPVKAVWNREFSGLLFVQLAKTNVKQMKKLLRRLFRISKFMVYLVLGTCVAWTMLTFPGLYSIANDPEARADHIKMLQRISDRESTKRSSQEVVFAASDTSSTNPFISLGKGRPSLKLRLDQLVYVRPTPRRKHYVDIMGKSGAVGTVYGSVAEVRKQIPSERSDYFYARGLLLNLNYVDQIHCESIPPEGESYFKLRVNDGCGSDFEVRIRPHAIPAF